MSDILIGTCTCPHALRVWWEKPESVSIRHDEMCPDPTNVYQIVSGSEYKSICTGSFGPHEHCFGPEYLANVTFL